MLRDLFLPFLSWLDHSILRHLVSASKNEVAMKMLDQFCSAIDKTQPFKSYPIPSPSQLIIPLYDSDYTLVATKCECNFEEVDLQLIINIRDTLIQKWEITDFAIQLAAVHNESSFLYWMIPACVVRVIEESAAKIEHELRESGIIMTSVFYNKSTTNDKGKVVAESYPFCFLHDEVNMYIIIKKHSSEPCSPRNCQ